MRENKYNLDSISQAGEGEEMVAPEVGDVVQIMVEGRVSRIEEGVAVVAEETANGEPLPETDNVSMSDDEALEAEERALREEMEGGSY